MSLQRSASQRAAEIIRQRITTAQIPGGTVLNQSALAKDLGMSRIPVRDALLQLAGQELVEARDGALIVREMSIADLEEIYEMREAIEPVATRIALPNVGRAEIVQMEEHLETMAEAKDLEAWMYSNRRFHRLIYGQTNRTRMIALIDSLAEQTDRYIFHYPVEDSEILVRFDEQHRLILNAAAERASGKEIEDLTKLHLATAHRMILGQLLATTFDGDGDRQRPTLTAGPAFPRRPDSTHNDKEGPPR